MGTLARRRACGRHRRSRYGRSRRGRSQRRRRGRNWRRLRGCSRRGGCGRGLCGSGRRRRRGTCRHFRRGRRRLGRRGRAARLLHQRDQGPGVDHVAQLDPDLLDYACDGRRNLHGRLVGFDRQERVFRLDRVARFDQDFDHGYILEVTDVGNEYFLQCHVCLCLMCGLLPGSGRGVRLLSTTSMTATHHAWTCHEHAVCTDRPRRGMNTHPIRPSSDRVSPDRYRTSRSHRPLPSLQLHHLRQVP